MKRVGNFLDLLPLMPEVLPLFGLIQDVPLIEQNPNPRFGRLVLQARI